MLLFFFVRSESGLRRPGSPVFARPCGVLLLIVPGLLVSGWVGFHRSTAIMAFTHPALAGAGFLLVLLAFPWVEKRLI